MGIFKPPADSRRRNKILVWGPSGSGKSTLALEFPRAAYMDNHGSVEKYEIGYPDHIYGRVKSADETADAIAEVLANPHGRRTVVLDDVTTYWTQVQEKWSDVFLKRNYGGKGDKKDFYIFQPSDWIHPKREFIGNIRKLINSDLNLIVIARSTKEYSGESKDFMTVIGETFAGEKNLPYEFDFVLELKIKDGKRLVHVHKQRVLKGTKPLPEEFEFFLNEKGNSFFQYFRDFCRAEDFDREPEPVAENPPAPDYSTQMPDTPVDVPAQQQQTPEAPITESQLKTLTALVKSNFTAPTAKEDWHNYLQSFIPGVTSAKQLTAAQAEAVIRNLKDIPF